MTPFFRKHAAIIVALITAIATVAAALLAKDTAYENAWLYVFSVGIVLGPLVELYLKKTEKNKR